MKVAAYLKCIPPGNKNMEKPQLLKNFIHGVNQSGDNGILVEDNNVLLDADVAIIQGFVHDNSKNTSHLRLRKQVFDTQVNNGKRCIIADSNLFLYADPGNTKTYLRYSFDGVFPNTGEYCNQNPNPARWEKMKADLGIDLKPWRSNGKYILVCCQRDGGWSMGGLQVVPWLVQTITQIRRYSSLPIKVRFHPGDKRSKDHLRRMIRMRMPDVSYSNSKTTINEDFHKAAAVVTYNSSPGVAAAIEGIPVIVLDPIRSQAASVSHHNIADLQNLREFDRTEWIQRIAQMHWTLEELRTGETWQHMKKWVKTDEN